MSNLENLSALDITPENSIVPVFLIQLTDKEISDMDAFIIQENNNRAIAEDLAATKEASRQSAISKLSALGITEEEISAMLGYN